MTPTPAPKFKVGDKVLWMGFSIVFEIKNIRYDNPYQAEYEVIHDIQEDGPEWALEEELRYA